jgi:hypothetical protein
MLFLSKVLYVPHNFMSVSALQLNTTITWGFTRLSRLRFGPKGVFRRVTESIHTFFWAVGARCCYRTYIILYFSIHALFYSRLSN